MLVPAVGAVALGGQEFDEPDTAFHHAAGEQAGAAEVFGILFIEAVEFGGGFGFAGQIDQLRDGGLHAEGELVIGYRGVDLVDCAVAVRDAAVEAMEQVELALCGLGIGFARGDVGDGEAAAAEERGLVAGGEEAATEDVDAAGRDHAGVHDDEAGEIFAGAAETVGHPGAHAWAALQTGARVHEIVAGGVFGVLGDHGADDGHVVDAGCDVRKQAADRGSGLSVALEFERGTEQQRADGPDVLWPLERQWLTALFLQALFGVERIDVRDAAIHEQEDDRFRFGGIVRRADPHRVERAVVGRGWWVVGGGWWAGRCFGEQRREGESAKSIGASEQGLSSGQHGLSHWVISQR